MRRLFKFGTGMRASPVQDSAATGAAPAPPTPEVLGPPVVIVTTLE